MNEETLFHEALSKPSAERAAFLEQACAGQPELRAAVEALLLAHEGSGSLLDQRAHDQSQSVDSASIPVPTSVYSSPAIAPGIVIAGRYTLQEKIGEGGMGEVWVAKQTEPVKRKVALKLIKAGMDSKAVLARFEQERQALALMDHPNIARVLDGGLTPFGRPFFVMDLVNGLPLTRFCDEARLTPKERLELFIPICQAVQHAHQKGIVHRDLKPANILVTLIDGKPIPKVIDFGVAKATGGKLTEESLSTQFGVLVGTLEYMSPEQAGFSGVDVDTRADIYSLGVILYELLTGLRPLDGIRLRKAAHAEMIRMIQEEEPSKPSTRLSSDEALPSLAALRHTDPKTLVLLLRGELDWVVMKCLEKSRERRYETVNGLSREIQRYLADEPVEARPPSAGYRLSKFFKRNKGPVVAACLVLLALLVGIGGTTQGLVRAIQAEGVAQQRYKEAENARAEAAASGLAEAKERQKAEQAEADTLADYRASTDDAIEQLIGSKPALGPKEKTYLENTLKRWQAFAVRQGDDQRSRAIRAEGHYRVATLWQKLGRDEVAQVEFNTAIDLQKKLVKQFPEVPEYQADLALSHDMLGRLFRKLSKIQDAQTQFELALGIQKKLVERFPSNADFQAGLSMSHYDLGILFADNSNADQALQEYKAALDLQKKLVARFPDLPEYQRRLSGTHNVLGEIYMNVGKFEAARAEYLAERHIKKQLVEKFPSVPLYQNDLAVSHYATGTLMKNHSLAREADRKQMEESIAEFRSASQIWHKLASQFPSVPDYQQYEARSHNSVGNLFLQVGKIQDALLEINAALELKKKLADQFASVPDYQADLARSHNLLSTIFQRQGKLKEATEELRKVRTIQQKLVEQYPNVTLYKNDLQLTYNNGGGLFADLQQPEDAIVEFRAALDLQKVLAEQFPALPSYKQNMVRSHYNLGNQLASLKKYEEVRAEFQAATKILKNLIEQSPTVSEYKIDLALICSNYGYLIMRQQGKPAESLEWYDQAIQTLNQVHETTPGGKNTDKNLRDCHWNRALAYDLLKRHVEAVKDWNRVVALSPQSERPKFRAARATSLAHAGQVEEALAEVVELTQHSTWSAGEWYDFACVYAVAGGKLPGKKKEYGDRAVELLRKAIKAGYKDTVNMAKDTDLDSLRGREDFKKLVAELEKKQP